MLSLIENISMKFMPHLFSSKGHIRLFIGSKNWADFDKLRLSAEEYKKFIADRQYSPFNFNIGKTSYWLFGSKFYKDNDGLRADEVKALLLTRKKLQQERINRAKTITSVNQNIQSTFTWSGTGKNSRGAIPDDVKLLVWQRDNGSCQKCGSRIELQYDHIIPFSMGGASTPENIQILCGKCNRAKSNSVI